MDLEGISSSVWLSPAVLRFTLVALLMLSRYTLVEGQYQVIGFLPPIVAAVGQDIILPCHVEPPLNVAGLTVEWSRPDLQPDPDDRLHRVDYVHLYRNSREVFNMKISSFVGRTALFPDGLRRGNVSLKILNVTLADEGRFKCFIPKLKGQKKSSIVRLIVEPYSTITSTTLYPRLGQTPGPKEETEDKGVLTRWSKLIPVVLSCVIVLCVGVTVYLTKCRKREKEANHHQELL